ncbi:hypothetical protein [Streptomyces sp. Z26]|uniref:hypothetical protein n=1 Tax=Streptomyces TaxID=1883 RepID=UPI000EF14E7B|nr:hypothetical protein [Streptomyces sp. Z26]RLL65573.1 hypothetical protein D7M15_00170 [Streptomyces sp. Z26]
MPYTGWSLEQRTVVRRYARFAAAFAVPGIMLCVFLVASESTGTWGVLAIVVCALAVAYGFVRKGKSGRR